MRIRLILACLSLLLSACSALSQPTATPTATATATASPTRTATDIPAPTVTPSITPTPGPSATPSPSATATATPTPTPTPSITPYPAAPLVFDNWQVADLPDIIRDGIANPMVAVLNANNQLTIANIATAQPNTGIQTIYLISPTNPGFRVPILELASNARLDVYLARGGQALAYVKLDQDRRGSGLYIMDLSSGFAARVLPGENPLVQRGLYDRPEWSPDGAELAITLATGYALDIFLYAKDGSGRRNITNHGSLDYWPRWSPDGRYLAFVSDRARCPSWMPGSGDGCDAADQPPPTGAPVHILELATGRVRRIADVVASEPPYWINERMLAFASGDPFDLLGPQRRLWRADIISGEAREIRLRDRPERASYLSEAWAPDGETLLSQVADQGNQLALMTAAGELLRLDEDLDFPRYGMSAAWSPDGQRLAIGGSAGQCPYGIRVKAADYRNTATGHPPPSMCDPVFSPDSRHVAFSGVSPRVDGRNDVFVASYDGFGATNLTADLRGHVELLGWVGGSP